MPEYQVLARKYRPHKFSEVVGQNAIVTTLIHAIQNDRIAQAYLFCGTRGTGKTTLARLFAMVLNCPYRTKSLEPCGICSSCKDIARSEAIDVLEIDGASHRGIEDIRQINEAIKFAPVSSKYKIYLIDEVHMLTKEAFNALLKTLEEPPHNVKFFFATTEPHKIPATILSRCQRFNLRRIPLEKIVTKLRKIGDDLCIEIDQAALTMVGQRAEGSMRDAESLLDQVISFSEGAITEEVVRDALGLPSAELLFQLDKAVESGTYRSAFGIVHEVYSSGRNSAYFLQELIQHFRSLLLVKTGMGSEEERIVSSVRIYTTEQLLEILEILTQTEQHFKSAPSEQIAIEMALLQVIQCPRKPSHAALVAKLSELEQKIAPKEKPLPSLLQSALDKGEEKYSAEVQREIQPEQPPLKKQGGVPQLKIREQAHVDTLLRFAAKELNGSLKKET
ncbi:MAG: DNA polymerase III subunit gamma/tau [Chlamydiales bacterium]